MYYLSTMAQKTNTVNISFRSDLLEAIDDVAKAESRSRSELIREAARMYIERKRRWDALFDYGSKQATAQHLAEGDVLSEVEAVRRERKPHWLLRLWTRTS